MRFAQRIEEASLNAWPALQLILLDGWMLRFSEGYSKRANAVITMYSAGDRSIEKIKECEHHYSLKGLPTIFRMTPFTPPDLDQQLAHQGYRREDPTIVMHRSILQVDLAASHNTGFQAQDLDEWLSSYLELSENQTDGGERFKKILACIPVSHRFACIRRDGIAVSCGFGTLGDEVLGLFSLVTWEALRRRGYGTQLVLGLISWAHSEGATHAYLQVRAGNAPAISLYSGLGFQELYRYWYRIKTNQNDEKNHQQD